MFRTLLVFLLFPAGLFADGPAPVGAYSVSDTSPARDLMSDTWVAVDDLGRPTPTTPDVPPPKAGKVVGLFYYIWKPTQSMLELKAPGFAADDPNWLYDNSRLLAANPEHPQWGPHLASHWWGEPLFGYYLGDDPWVIRRHLSMLANAGVDVLFLDATNAATYRTTYTSVFSVAMQMRREGNVTPQFAFITHSQTAETVTKLYEEFYKPNLYPDLWFHWEGKPLIFGDSGTTFASDYSLDQIRQRDDEHLPTPLGNWHKGDPMSDEVKGCFTWRNSWAWTHSGEWFGDGKDKWPWLDDAPQKPGWHDAPNVPEEVSVSTAQHPITNIGKSFHQGSEPPRDRFDLTPDTNKGLYFQEQWDSALKIDPKVIWITQWNEWAAMRFVAGQDGAHGFVGRPQKADDSYFVDDYNAEYDRDIEPMKGGWGDNYYMQMVGNIRRFKGARPSPVDDALHIIQGMADWKSIAIEYRHGVGNTWPRNWPGWGGLRYINSTGRNNIITAKVALDSTSVYFYAQTREPLTDWHGKNWMQLLINSDRDYASGWNGYDFCVNFQPTSDHETSVDKWEKDHWQAAGAIKYVAQDNELFLTVPRAMLGLSGPVSFDFHWIDNAPPEGDIKAFYQIGESAPDGRFNYRYTNSSHP